MEGVAVGRIDRLIRGGGQILRERAEVLAVEHVVLKPHAHEVRRAEIDPARWDDRSTEDSERRRFGRLHEVRAVAQRLSERAGCLVRRIPVVRVGTRRARAVPRGIGPPPGDTFDLVARPRAEHVRARIVVRIDLQMDGVPPLHQLDGLLHPCRKARQRQNAAKHDNQRFY